ncbi:SipW-dependent-type signal peptide-containing protein [Collinsella aerofaciens]|uniref:SipW-dependent-type signal peptide-containing protein n=1 Tax=Collinsella aerofaciens TaxID=74426 RepID=UPI00232ED866|nr:SipW-dependent-type signal peptide-containing protein [Collinsella aerofaciens]MDB1867630.1 SipW-dependent-type signal peptide-containing protein [Collinsella aerofaciens]
MENKKKKRYGIIAALLLLVLAAGVGTYAWLSATQTKVNEFTVGSIDKPEVKPDPDQPNKPGTNPTNPSVDGYLFETNWTDKSKMIPGTEIKKNPNVGIGKDSDPSYVFIYVKNAIVKNEDGALAKTPYFSIGNGWRKVDGDFTGKAETNGTEGQYVSGLFVYTNTTNAPAVLAPSGGKAAYTGELFSTVSIPNTLNSTDVVQNPAMTVSCYIFGADQKGDKADAANNALEQAKTWAATQAQA